MAQNEFDSSIDWKVGINFEPDILDAPLLVHLPPQVHHHDHLQPADGQVEGGGKEEVVLRGNFSTAGSPLNPLDLKDLSDMVTLTSLLTLVTLMNFKRHHPRFFYSVSQI